MNSNELNEKILDACLDSACFQILHAYIQLGGWNPELEVFLPQTYWKRWGINPRTLSRHRSHLVEAGWLTPTDNLSREGNTKYRVTVPQTDCLDPLDDLSGPPSQYGVTPQTDCPTEVIKNNIQNNEHSNQVEQPAVSARESTQGIPVEATSGVVPTDSPAASPGVVEAPAGTPPDLLRTDLLARTFEKRDQDNGIHGNTKEHYRRMAERAIAKESS